MARDTTTIAKCGGLEWCADAPDAGPYHLANRWQIFASFGTRSLNAGKPGTAAQREAFEQSRAAFEACRLAIDPECFNAAELRSFARAATAAARAEWRRWADTINRLGGAEAINGYQGATFDRMMRQIEKK